MLSSKIVVLAYIVNRIHSPDFEWAALHAAADHDTWIALPPLKLEEK